MNRAPIDEDRPAQLLASIQRMQGRADAALEEKERILHSVGIARSRQGKKADVEGVLDDLEQRFHEKSMGILEELLSAFMTDVLPRDGVGSRVEMQLETQRGLPALQVQVRNGDQVEDALRGRGGSVTNVISAGLRLIAVARSTGMSGTLMGMRPFLVLDEADCWLAPNRVEDFGNVLHRLAQQFGLQMLIISHHQASLFQGFPVHLERIDHEDGYPAVRVRHVPKKQVADMEVVPNSGYSPISKIELKNFLSHQDTVIPLSRGITIITGDNDVGKSVVTEAIRAVAYNDATDSMIRHNAAQAEITIHFEDGSAIQWVRVRRGNPKVLYRWIQGESIEQETSAGRDIPEWVINRMGIRMREDMDVQIGDQKSPVFLLNETPSKRAAILDIGRESRYLRALRERWKKQTDEDRKSIRDGEQRLKQVERIIDVLKNLQPAAHKVGKLVKTAVALREKTQTVERMDALMLVANRRHQMTQVWGTHAVDVIPVSPTVPADRLLQEAEAVKAQRIQARLNVWERYPTAVINLMKPVHRDRLQAEPSLARARYLGARLTAIGIPIREIGQVSRWQPALDRIAESVRIGRSTVAIEKRMRVWGSIKVSALPESAVKILSSLGRLETGVGLGRNSAAAAVTVREDQESLSKTREALAVVQAEKQRVMTESGTCPMCGSAISGAHNHMRNAS